MERSPVERATNTEWASLVGLCQTYTMISPPREDKPAGTNVLRLREISKLLFIRT